MHKRNRELAGTVSSRSSGQGLTVAEIKIKKVHKQDLKEKNTLKM